MEKEKDFTKGERRKFHNPDGEFVLPKQTDSERDKKVLEEFEEWASTHTPKATDVKRLFASLRAKIGKSEK